MAATAMQEETLGPVGFFQTAGVELAVSIQNITVGGIAVTDVDKDLQWEYFFNVQSGPNLLLKMTDGKLLDIAKAYGAQQEEDEGRVGTATVACDIRGNGRDEIYVAGVGADGEPLDAVLAYDVDMAQFRPRGMHTHGGKKTACVACVDAGGAGTYDMYMGQEDGGLHVWDLRHRKSVTVVPALPETEAGPTGQTISAMLAAPLLEHGPPAPPDVADIFVANYQGPNRLLAFDGLTGGVVMGSEEANSAPRPGTGAGWGRPLADYRSQALRGSASEPGGHARALAVLDANDDGLLDVIVGNDLAGSGGSAPATQLMINMGGGVFEPSGSDAFKRTKGRVRAVLVADFDNDGTEEVLLLMQAASSLSLAQPNLLLRRDTRVNRTASWEQVDAGEMTDAWGRATSAAVADVNGDGRLDLIMVKGAEGAAAPAVLTGTEGKGNRYLRVVPLTRAGGPARGAVVRVVDMAGRRQVRVLDTGGASQGQSEPVAHFGFGPAGMPFSVAVTWPDGRSTTLLSPGVDVQITVPYPYADLNPPSPYVGSDPGDTPASGGTVAAAPAAAAPAAADGGEDDTCGEATCLTMEISPCPDANCSDPEGLCAEGSFFDRVPGADDASPDRCFCRQGYEINPCPEGPGNDGMCDVGFSFYRAVRADGSESCHCKKGDGSGKKDTNTTGGIDAKALEAFRNCLAANPSGLLRCIAVMEALGYPFDPWGAWSPPTPTPTPGPEDLDAESYVLDPCPPDGSVAAMSACRDGYLLMRHEVAGEEQCTCDLERTSAQYEVDPCPAEGDEYECQPSYHLERRNGKCFCSKDEYEIDPCPAEGEGENLCNAGFSFVREIVADVERCKCKKSRWEIKPCPDGNGTGVCPDPMVFVREVGSSGAFSCFCVTPEEEDKYGPWHGGCEHCAYGNGACAYSSEKGWFCLCEEGDEGPDCIKSSWKPRASLQNRHAKQAGLFMRRKKGKAVGGRV